MQYPQIQFYKGSLVRLASGKLKQVEDLSSDDFLESARLIRPQSPPRAACTNNQIMFHQKEMLNKQQQSSNIMSTTTTLTREHRPMIGLQLIKDENNNNNNSVFNSPEPTPTSFDNCSPPSMKMMDTSEHNHYQEEDDDDDDGDGDDDGDEELVDVVTTGASCDVDMMNDKVVDSHTTSNHLLNHLRQQHQAVNERLVGTVGSTDHDDNDDLYIDSSVVRDFLEVGPPSSTSPTSSTSSLAYSNNPFQHHHYHHHLNSHLHHLASTASSSSSSTSNSPPSSLVINNNNNNNNHHHHHHHHHYLNSNSQHTAQLAQPANQTVLIKFFLESNRSIVFIEVPIEHPFFVFHRGWSSWNPQCTYDKFGLKCRKLKIGDTCISLIRRKRTVGKHEQQQQQQQHVQLQQQESDQCNILFSSIKINE